MARTAAVAGTATAVSNRVSRRQGQRWAAEEEPQATPPPPAAATSSGDMVEQLKGLAELRDQGVLTEQEFGAQKARLLAG